MPCLSLFDFSLPLALEFKQVTPQQLRKVTVDTTVQEKAIAFPTDARLYTKMLLRLVNLSRRHGLGLRQTYVLKAPQLLRQQGRYAHAKQYKRAGAGVQKPCIHCWVVWCGIFAARPAPLDETLLLFLERAEKLLAQTQKSNTIN
jgi:hypothetical protein